MYNKESLDEVALECEVLNMYYGQIRKVAISHMDALDKIEKLTHDNEQLTKEVAELQATAAEEHGEEATAE